MFRLVAIAFFVVQFILVAAALIWISGKFGFAPAIPYVGQIEGFFRPIWHAIIDQF